MEHDLTIDVGSLDAPHRRALEDVIGRRLAANHRLFIHVAEVEGPVERAQSTVQSLDDWTAVYAGLSDEEVEAIDQVAKTRANLTRNVP